jgi:hypothetical protein
MTEWGTRSRKPSNEEPGLVAVEEAGLEGRRERDDDEREQGDCGW